MKVITVYNADDSYDFIADSRFRVSDFVYLTV